MLEAIEGFELKLRAAFEAMVAKGIITAEEADHLNDLLDEIDEIDEDVFMRRLQHRMVTSGETAQPGY